VDALRLSGLYAITDSALAGDHELVEQVRAAIAGGARLIQYRDKSDDDHRRRQQATALLDLCNAAQLPLIINDDVELAAAIGAHGVHLGKDDPALASARERLGPSAIIGVSCYDQYPLAEAARQAGADYVAFGSFHPSDTKPDAVRADPALLRRARRELGLPTVAIGGISPENGRALIDAGADMLAVIRGLFAQTDIRTAAQAYAALFAEEDHEEPMP